MAQARSIAPSAESCWYGTRARRGGSAMCLLVLSAN